MEGTSMFVQYRYLRLQQLINLSKFDVAPSSPGSEFSFSILICQFVFIQFFIQQSLNPDCIFIILHNRVESLNHFGLFLCHVGLFLRHIGLFVTSRLALCYVTLGSLLCHVGFFIAQFWASYFNVWFDRTSQRRKPFSCKRHGCFFLLFTRLTAESIAWLALKSEPQKYFLLLRLLLATKKTLPATRKSGATTTRRTTLRLSLESPLLYLLAR